MLLPEVCKFIFTIFLQTKSKRQVMNMKARVKMNMKAQLDEEMDLYEGEIVTVTEIVDKNWYRCVTVLVFRID
jgi:hypothetical protein